MATPDPKNHGSFLKRIVAAGRRAKKLRRDEIPPERLERWARWWEMHIMGLSPAKIAARENGSFTIRQVNHGLTKYAELATDPLTRDARLARSVHLTNLLKTKAIDSAQKLEAEARQHGGLIKRTERETTDANGNVIRLEQTTTERADREVRDWLRLALDCEKYLATLHGLLALANETNSDLDALDISFEGMLVAEPKRSERSELTEPPEEKRTE